MANQHLIEVENLKMYFKKVRGVIRQKVSYVKAVDNVSFFIDRGETFGLVGESGCGKSTLGRLLLGLLPPTQGQVFFDGRDLAACSPRDLRALRRQMQMVFQDPYGSLNPAKKIGWIMEEPLRIQRKLPGKERRQKVLEMLKKVGLDEKIADRYPNQLSGGQRQRVCIGEALMTNPGLLVADEAVSALDVTIQAQILELLEQLKEEMGLSILFISHDMRVVYQLCDRVMIMKDGTIVESGDVDTVYFSPQHEYTKELLEAAGIGEDEA